MRFRRPKPAPPYDQDAITIPTRSRELSRTWGCLTGVFWTLVGIVLLTAGVLLFVVMIRVGAPAFTPGKRGPLAPRLTTTTLITLPPTSSP